MNARRSPVSAMLDMVVYIPLGLALTFGEELPKLAAKGRAKVDPQVSTARVVGQFAVAEGRRRASRLTDGSSAGSPSPLAATASRAATDSQAATDLPPVTPSVVPPRPNGTESVSLTPSPEATLSSPRVPPARPSPRIDTTSPDSPSPNSPSPDSPSPDSLAIPGYDSLSASQVVQRLAGLSAEELNAVGTYEAATRGRRTILARVSQLRSA